MKILVYTGYNDTPKYKEMGDFSSLNKLQYCQRHSYSFLCERDYSNYKRNISWFKIKKILEVLPSYDWVWWTDADSLCYCLETKLEDVINYKGLDKTTVMVPDRTEISLTQEGEKFFIVSPDLSADLGPCLGGFLIKNCPLAFKFLKDIYASTDFEEGPWFDQHEAHRQFFINKEYRDGLKVIPRIFMGSWADFDEKTLLLHDKFHLENGRVVPK